ncbi:MAG: DUF1592 domain-containing protein, partial [Planctomycetota bacterium]
IRQFADRAFRRPATKEELNRLNDFYQLRISKGSAPLAAYKDTLKTILCSPGFLYLQPVRQSNRVQPHGVATRLSYFLSSSTPDAQLSESATDQSILDREVRAKHAMRLLNTETRERFVHEFLDSWLNLRTLGEMPPDRALFWQYYAWDLRSDALAETRSFFDDLIQRNASADSLLDSEHAFLNRDLAILYDMPDAVPATDPRPDRIRRVALSDNQRGGLLGQSSVLTVTANGIETSPITRGVWMLENIIGLPTPPPPEDVPAIDPDVRGATSIRNLLEKHRESDACYQCHRRIDPMGFALEAYDPIGVIRSRYTNKSKIDTAGELPSGDRFSDIRQLKQLLLQRKRFVVRTLVERLFAYALGRPLDPINQQYVDAVLQQTQPEGYRLRDLIVAVVKSPLFTQ